jgi:DNA invertase Pin-like site-specific DNA recombinase
LAISSADARVWGYVYRPTDWNCKVAIPARAQSSSCSVDFAASSSHDGELVADFCEIESGKRSDRPQLAAAIAAAKKAKATLIIAKLDRLARSVHLISGLMESSVDFVAADNPHANKLMIHLLAAFAEHAAHA